ncbi:histidine phosphatase family protein [Actibacterium pelagium]|uniref:Histidine phosphatase superfamily (Branch 1) n=1 Tax=Actibacterium pelagium TaxID=2029103 RepID=A0A917AFP8_9RHOB|nr:histidine phosphatase family protein [Actibacterium pelagium]GGE47524.1 hypothetical protein GCM10011517_14150 [Actibacterium pelagium]
MFTRLLTAVFALLFLTIPADANSAKVKVPADTTLIILRHADRDGELLNKIGEQRAAALVDALDGIAIDVVYSPGIQRNLDTAVPLLEARGMEVTRISPTKAAEIMFSESAGKTIVWVGNKGNLRGIWEDIAAPGEPPLNYGDLFFVTAGADGQVQVERRHHGPKN